MSLIYEIKQFKDIEDDTKDFLVELLRNYYSNINGIDIFDAFLCVTNTNSNDYKDKDIKDITSNYKLALDNLNVNIDILLIYDNELNLIGSSILKKEDLSIRVLDIVFENLNDNEKRDYFEETVEFLIHYLESKEYKTIYLEIPIKESHLLLRADSLGFREDFANINDKLYILKKDIG